MSLFVSEIFLSIQGESTHAGRVCAFVRLAGCNLDCEWCDTEYAAKGVGEKTSVDAIIEKVKELGSPLVEVTGGEPLHQEKCGDLLTRLLDENFEVLVETNGSYDLGVFDSRAKFIVDFKLPGSGAYGSFLKSNFEKLSVHDEIKFVVADRADFDMAVEVIKSEELAGRVTLLASPVFGKVEAKELARWIIDTGLPIRLSLQIHKLIWPAHNAHTSADVEK